MHLNDTYLMNSSRVEFSLRPNLILLLRRIDNSPMRFCYNATILELSTNDRPQTAPSVVTGLWSAFFLPLRRNLPYDEI
jgi:hypothetical protein